MTNGRWPASLSVLVASVCAARRAQHQLLIGTVGQTAWACSVNDTGMSLLLLPRRSQILPHMLTICKGQPTAEDSFIQWVSRQQSGQRSRMVFAPDSLRSTTLSQEFPLMVGNSLLPGPLRNISSPLPSCLGCLPLSLPFCVLSPVPWRASRSPWCLPPLLLGFALSSSVFFAYGFPLPLSSRTCRCGRPLDIFGHHRAACSRGSLEVVGSRWRVRQPGFVGKVEVAWPQTCS